MTETESSVRAACRSGVLEALEGHDAEAIEEVLAIAMELPYDGDPVAFAQSVGDVARDVWERKLFVADHIGASMRRFAEAYAQGRLMATPDQVQ